MATSSYIFIRLNDDDIGKEILYDKTKFSDNVEGNNIPPKTIIKKKYIGILHNWDSHIYNLGKKLIQNYNTKESILNLISGGNASTIIDCVVQYYVVDQNESWEYNKPVFSDNEPELKEDLLYLFQNDKWYVKSRQIPELTELSYLI